MNQDESEDPRPEEINTHVERFIELQQPLDAEVRSNVGDAQERQKKHDAEHQQGTYDRWFSSRTWKLSKKVTRWNLIEWFQYWKQ